jgi:hypothetical protein
MTRTIPARTIFTCDACQREDPPRRMEGKMHLYRHGLDHQGTPVGPGGQRLELCDACCMALEGHLPSFITQQHKLFKHECERCQASGMEPDSSGPCLDCQGAS